ncbi:hypothetical protein GCM10010459_20560 [Microbacterium schleiferi]
MFQLAGLTSPAYLQWWLRPDVSLASAHSRVLGIGDAKATERPGDEATLRRLIGYVRAARWWHEEGWSIHMSLAVAPEDGRGWLGELRRAWARGGLLPGHEAAVAIAPDLAVVSLSTSRFAYSTNVGVRRNLEA